MNTESQSQFVSIISDAIKSKRVIQIKHKGNWRTVEPYIIGNETGINSTTLYGLCRDVIPALSPGQASRWQIFHFDDIEVAEVTNYQFQPHVDYKGHCDRISNVHVRLPIRSSSRR